MRVKSQAVSMSEDTTALLQGQSGKGGPRVVPARTFAGAGGLHMHGDMKFGCNGKEVTLSLSSVCAVEIEPIPAETYRQNNPDTTVLTMGVGRFVIRVLAVVWRAWVLLSQGVSAEAVMKAGAPLGGLCEEKLI